MPTRFDSLQLVERAQAGSEDALTRLFVTHQPSLLRYLRVRLPDAADDLAAQAWLDAARNLHRFAGDDVDFRRWLFTIARRRVMDELRRRRRRPLVSVAHLPDAPESDCPFDRRDELAWALSLVRQLPSAQADAVALRIIGGFEIREVAVLLGRTEGSVRVLVHRGLLRLRRLLAPDDSERAVTDLVLPAMEGLHV